MTQATLFKAPKLTPRTIDDDVQWLEEVLEFEEWMTAKEIRDCTGLTDRKIRAIAEASKGEIISGQLGYRLTKDATKEEIQHATSWLKSQAKKMIRRAIRIERRWHG